MAKRFTPSVLSANHLIEGDAVWWTGAEWSRDIAAAEVATTPEAAESLTAFAASDSVEAEVVGPYLVEIGLESGAPYPVVRREAIRADREPTFAYGDAAAPLREAA